MVAGINSKNPSACNLLPGLGCTTLLTSVPQLNEVPKDFKEGLTVADLCPCGICGNVSFLLNSSLKFGLTDFC